MQLPQVVVSHLADRLVASDSANRLTRFVPSYLRWKAEDRTTAALDFVFGNPQQLPDAQYVDILRNAAVPNSPAYFAYRINEPSPRAQLAPLLAAWYRLPYVDPDDLFLTTGAFAGLTVALNLFVNPNDRIIAPTPGWFYYDRLSPTQKIDWVPVYPSDPDCQSPSDLARRDIDAILHAIEPDTKAIIFNNPHNPTGRLYDEPELLYFAQRLLERVKATQSPIYVICDDAYCDIVFDGALFKSLSLFYPYAITVYTFGKVLLSPSQRIGYLLFPNDMPGKHILRSRVIELLHTTGYSIPNAIMIEALPKLMQLRTNFSPAPLQARRDLMVSNLTSLGYAMAEIPRGTFYLMVRVPDPPTGYLANGDESPDEFFCEKLANRGVLVMPGAVLGVPNTFRVCLTGTDEVLLSSLGAFRDIMTEWQQQG